MEAARIMLESGIKDFYTAKRKAAARLGNSESRHMPRNTEVEQAMIDYQRLFRADSQPHTLRRLRETALDAMKHLERFRPRLVGPVLAGTADTHTCINLHVFAETPEEVAIFLMQEDIPYQSDQRQLRGPGEQRNHYPVFRFVAGDTPVELSVFPLVGLRQAPLSPVHGKPMERASVEEVRQLLAREEQNREFSCGGV